MISFIEPLAQPIGGPPKFLGLEDWDGKPHRRALSHFWMGNTPVTTGLHTDDFDNVIAVHRGHKSVLLFRPEERHNLYYEPAIDVYTEYNVTTAVTRVVSATVSDNHALVPVFRTETEEAKEMSEAIRNDYPKYLDAAGLQCEVGPGDTIVIPKLWHHALASDPDDSCIHMATNWWFAER